MKCSQCDTEREPSDLFCRACGKKFDPPTSTSGREVSIDWVSDVMRSDGFEVEDVTDPGGRPNILCSHATRRALMMSFDLKERVILCQEYFTVAKTRVERRDLAEAVAAMNASSTYCAAWRSGNDNVGVSWCLPLYETMTSTDVLRVVAAGQNEVIDNAISTGLIAFLA